MRIISGSVGGRKLSPPSNPKHNCHIRPTSDRAREAIFNIIGFDKINNAVVLDLFAGTGALGLEALSRGAQEAVFVDNYLAAVNLISRNIELCNFSKSTHIIKRDLTKGLAFLSKYLEKFDNSTSDNVKKFDLVFLDPPYEKELAGFFLSELQTNNLISDTSLIVYEDRAISDLPEEIVNLVLFDKRKYGDTGFWMYSASNC